MNNVIYLAVVAGFVAVVVTIIVPAVNAVLAASAGCSGIVC